MLPGRLQRLADELAEEGLPALEGAPDAVGALVELAYALRPQLHEGRVPTYGVLMPPSPAVFDDEARSGPDAVELVPVAELAVQFARRFADGVTSETIYFTIPDVSDGDIAGRDCAAAGLERRDYENGWYVHLISRMGN